MEDFNVIQRTALTKFNIFYSICFDNSQKHLMNIIQRGGIIPEAEPLNAGGIVADFDRYFKQNTAELYKLITEEGHGNTSSIRGYEQISAYLPISEINSEC